jgi:hypothetical protein
VGQITPALAGDGREPIDKSSVSSKIDALAVLVSAAGTKGVRAMETARKALLLTVLVAGLAPALGALALWLAAGDSSHAQGAIALAIDMDPTGNSCPGDGATDCDIGTVDICVTVVPGVPFDIDILATGLPNGLSGWNWDLDWRFFAATSVTAQVESNPAINLIAQSPGSAPVSTSEGVPDAVSPHTASVTDPGAAETTPPFTKGVLSRLTLETFDMPGIYNFSFVPSTYDIKDQDGASYRSTTGVVVLDGSRGCGMLAIFPAVCPIGPCTIPAGGLAELPVVSDSSGPPYAVLAGLAAVTLVVLAAGAWYARRRWAR